VISRKNSKDNVFRKRFRLEKSLCNPAHQSPPAVRSRGKAADFIFFRPITGRRSALVLARLARSRRLCRCRQNSIFENSHFLNRAPLPCLNWSIEKWEHRLGPDAGRVIFEGYSAKEVAFPIRVFARMSVGLILTNAVGGSTEVVHAGWCDQRSHQFARGQSLTGPNDGDSVCVFHDHDLRVHRRFR